MYSLFCIASQDREGAKVDKCTEITFELLDGLKKHCMCLFFPNTQWKTWSEAILVGLHVPFFPNAGWAAFALEPWQNWPDVINSFGLSPIVLPHCLSVSISSIYAHVKYKYISLRFVRVIWDQHKKFDTSSLMSGQLWIKKICMYR